MRIEDYAIIGNNRTAALVGRNGSIDWLCAPRFDAPACFAALLGTSDHGRWLLAPRGAVRRVERRYRDQTLVLETDFHTAGGTVRVVDCMPAWEERTDVVRIVEGLRGRVSMRMELVIRGGYGVIVPWVRRADGALLATAGPESLELRSGCACAWQGIHDGRLVQRRPRRARCLRADAFFLALAAPAAD